MTTDEIVNKIRTGEIDYNNRSRFFAILIKGLLWKLRQDIKVRGQVVPHFILNTGDEEMVLEAKGQDYSKEPLDISNEDYIYTILPRCVVTPQGITLQSDQLSSPYANGLSQYEDEENIITFSSEFRRMPLKMSVELQYLVDSFADLMEITQQIITKLSFIQTYSITYMGQMIECSYAIPESLDGESILDFDEATTEDRRRKMNITIEVDTNLPIYDVKTIILADKYIRSAGFQIDFNDHTTSESIEITPKNKEG